ncbi:MAG: HEAT repeat domain-containing protein, partial [Planctomycetes bacterium]|nr:HEAT repeat domain-containing protein [Planctomycetota bacterium]
MALLASYETPEAIETLREILKGKDGVARNRALSALIQHGDKEAGPYLIDCLKGDDEYFRTYAAYALGVFKDRRAVKPLCEYLQDSIND